MPAPSLARNPWLVCAFHGVQMSLFPMAVITLFYRQEIGMTMRDIFLLQGCFGFAMAVMELPSGYVADRIGYRTSLVLSSVLMVAGWTVYAASDRMATVVVAELVLGVATAFISGCDSALLYESLVETDREAEYGAWVGRMRFCGQAAEGSAALVAGLLYAVWPRLPFALEAVLWIGGAVLALRFAEPTRHRPSFAGTLGQLRVMVRHVAREAPDLRAVMAATVVLGMASFVPVWSIQVHATESGMPAAWLGPLWAAANFIVALGSLGSSRVRVLLGFRGLMLLCVGLVASGYAVLGLVPTAATVAGYLLLTVMRGLFGPTLLHEEQRRISSRDRAGFLSLRSLVFRGSFCVLGPVVGLLMDRHGQRPVYLGLGAALVLAALAAWSALARRGVGQDGRVRAD